ncbi:hypothetical protein [Streptomyces sp. NRRL S-1022]|uniref:hypothetical protein n=1 Tax=Streptomyces sp. NRRL S-1022 TaxID=1463880 RepID=UPI0004C2091B|nr:hypothetical protein [Streptomyces sp. NRRL S-1022]
MPDPSTTRLGLYKSKSDGSELVNYTQDIGQNWDRVDAAVGFAPATSSTRPSSPYAGKAIMETDTSYRTYFSNGTAPASGSWVEIPNSSGTFGSTLKLASSAQLTIGVDVNLFRSAANVLRTNDALIVDGALTASSGLSVAGNLSVSGIGQTQYVVKTADETVTSSATLQNDDHLVLPVVANAVYTFALDLYMIDAADFVGDFKMSFTCPTGATFDMHGSGAHTTDLTAGTSANGEWIGKLATTSAGANLSFGCGNTSVTAARVYGRLVVSGTAGTFQLQWAQNASDASGTTLKAGSYMTMTRIA